MDSLVNTFIVIYLFIWILLFIVVHRLKHDFKVNYMLNNYGVIDLFSPLIDMDNCNHKKF